MAWTAPNLWVAGAVLTAAQMNTYVSDNDSALRAGGLAIASQAANDFIYASSASQLARLAASDGKVPKYTTSGGWAMAGLQLELIVASSGTDTNAAATNVLTFTPASLTAKDRLLIFATVESLSQATTKPVIYNNTDGVEVIRLSFDGGSGDISAGAGKMGSVEVQQFQSAATKIGAVSRMYTDASPGSRQDGSNTSTFTTPWTSSPQFALRHGGVTAGGTFAWSLSAFVARGQ